MLVTTCDDKIRENMQEGSIRELECKRMQNEINVKCYGDFNQDCKVLADY